MENVKTYSKEQLIELYDFVEEVNLRRGIRDKESGEILTEGLLREYITKDQMVVTKDHRSKNNAITQSALLIQRIFYIKTGDDEYRNLTFAEIERLKGADQTRIVKKMEEMSGELEDL